MEVWDELVLQEQEDTIGRDKLHGAPQSGGHEFTPPDFKKKDQDGKLMIAEDSHVAVVHPDNNGGTEDATSGLQLYGGHRQFRSS